MGYLADEGLSTAVFLALSLKRPLLLEGEAGVGKTELAKVLAAVRGSELIRLQCYEGIDASQAVYDWDYSRQLLHLRAAEASGEAQSKATESLENELYDERFLIRRALLRAIEPRNGAAPVLLIDEIDRADEAFEAFLLEVLADYQITVPELGTLKARHIPQVILTSNGTRELSDALRRRCLYHWLDYPTLAREIAIVRGTLPQAESALVEQSVAFVQRLRRDDLGKTPGVAETLDWVRALHRLQFKALPDDPDALMATLGCLLKTREDRFQVGAERVQQLIEGRRAGVAEKA